MRCPLCRHRVAFWRVLAVRRPGRTLVCRRCLARLTRRRLSPGAALLDVATFWAALLTGLRAYEALSPGRAALAAGLLAAAAVWVEAALVELEPAREA